MSWYWLLLCPSVIDVGSEWRTFSNEKSGVDPSRVGGPENPLLNGSDLSTMIGPGRGDASFDDFGISKYQNRRTVSLLPFPSYHLADISAVQALNAEKSNNSNVDCLKGWFRKPV